ncbi:MAG TPA: hypothetical protein VFP58_00840 [Candidatus Eisenbacteria bacterium]|nr:hypothetical protein [Candidatus Eisenbacteria bacterium]
MILPLLLAGLAVAAGGCGAPFAEGSSRELTIVSILAEDAPELLLLRAVVQRPALRIDDETTYRIRFARPDDARARRSSNVILAGFGPPDRIPGGRKSDALREALRRSPRPYAFVPDLWRRGQAVGIFWTKTRAEWMTALSREQNRFFLELDRATFAAVRERVHALPRDGRAERALEESLGIRMIVPRGFRVRVDRARNAALLMDEGPPARLLRLRRAEGTPPRDLLRARSDLARLFRPRERTLDDLDPMLVPDEMAGATRRLHGRWADEEVSAGGPYRFYEVARGARRYHVDLAVFAPGRAKLPHLRELQAVAESLSEP